MGIIGLMLVGILCYAEEINFATVLSSPVGTFTTLETANPNEIAQSGRVNFCNSKASGGTILLAGSKAPSLGNVVLDNEAKLASASIAELLVSSVSLRKEGKMVGKAIFANVATNNTNRGSGAYSLPGLPLSITQNKLKATEMYVGGTMDLEGLKTTKLYLGDCEAASPANCSYLTTSSGSSQKSIWTNEYQNDYTKKSDGTWIGEAPADGSNYQRQFLLRQGARRIINPNLGGYQDWVRLDPEGAEHLDKEFSQHADVGLKP